MQFYSKDWYETRLEKFLEKKHFSTLILGTSRTYEGIHPFYFRQKLYQEAFKEASQGKGPKYNYYFYQLYKKYAGTPKVVVYGVDYFIYSIKSDQRWMSRFNIDESQTTAAIFSSPLLLLKYKKLIDNFQNNIILRMQEEKKEINTQEMFKDFIETQDYKGADLPASAKKLIIEEPLDYLHQDMPPPPGEEGEYFWKLLSEWSKDNVRVILVALPDFYGSFRTNVQMRDFINQLKTLRKFNKNLVVINYNRPDSFPMDIPDNFMDGGWGMTNSHLSRTGAKLLNEKLMKDIKRFYE